MLWCTFTRSFALASKNGEKCRCTFLRFFALHELQKNTGWVDLNLEKPVVKPVLENIQKCKHSGKLK